MMLPDSNFLPAPLWLITILHTLTLTLHFAAMNVLLGGLILLAADRFERQWENPAVKRFVKLFPSAVAATVTLGVAPLLFFQLVYPAQMYSATIVSGGFWLLVIPAIILAYASVYATAFQARFCVGGKRCVVVSALLLIYVSLIFSSVASLAERPDLLQRLYRESQTGWHLNPEVGGYLIRWLHMITGAVTVAGYLAGVLGRDDGSVFRLSGKMFTVSMAAAALAGIGYLASLGPFLSGFMRSDANWLLTAAVLLSLGSLHFFYRRRFAWSGGLLFSSLFLMVWIRHLLRILKLGGHFNPAAVRVAPQWSPLVLFGSAFLVAAALVFYMLRLYFVADVRSAKEISPKAM
jgi:hypothetical protein